MKRGEYTKKQKAVWIKVMGWGASLGLTVAFSAFAGLWGGRFLDDYLGTTPWMMIFFGFMGIMSSFLGIYKQISKMTEGPRQTDVNRTKKEEK